MKGDVDDSPRPRAAIEFRGLSHRFPDGALGLDDVTLSIAPGEFAVVAGRNGAGKSLLMRHAVDLAKPTAGVALVGGERAGSRAAKVVGYVFQDAEAQSIGATALEDASFGPANALRDAAAARRLGMAALERVHLARVADRAPDSLSGGERRALAIAGAIALDPECLILDEPFANLDYPAIKATLALLLELRDAGKAVVVLTHELEKVLAHATRLVVMQSGRIEYDGDPSRFPPERFEAVGLRDPYRGGLALGDLTWAR
jgi:biotin transport system ATP-binding protein